MQQSANQNEKRNKQAAIPNNIETYLNEAQVAALASIENFGWSLAFIRRPLFQEPTPVVMGPNGQPFGVIEADGTINQNIEFTVREVT